MAGCLMARKISSAMQDSCACSECAKWKVMPFNATKMKTSRNVGSCSVKRHSWLEGISMFAGNLLRMTRSSWTKERGFKYSVKDSYHNVTRTVQWRFVFADPANEENK